MQNSKGKDNRKKNKNTGPVMDDLSQQIDYQLRKGNKVNGNSRKNQISINHLLDFQSYRDLKEYHEKHSKQQSKRRNSSTRYRSRERPNRAPLHGMSFINVNYKFVVDYRNDYKPQKIDPNIPVDLSDILTIIVPKGNACPICLSDDPVAPRMITSCGHIICLSCLLSLLDNDVPKAKKKESQAVVEKYRECPLCSSVIRKNEIKPVLINNIDERFEIPKVEEEVVLTLMSRPHDRVFALPDVMNQYFDVIEDFPWINYQREDFGSYLRIFKGDLDYLLEIYDAEKEKISSLYQEEKELYCDDGKFVQKAINSINDDIESWTLKFSNPLPLKKTMSNHDAKKLGESYYFYQTGFNAPSIYVLSPLDIKVLKNTYNNDYSAFPSSIVAKIENIKYEELTAEASMSRYKYLSHLPIGTLIGFMECNWNNNEFISQETWERFKGDLIKRSRGSHKKFQKEEKDRRRALNEEERKARDFIEMENNNNHDFDHDRSFYEPMNFGSLTITDYRDLPSLPMHGSSDSHGSGSDSSTDAGNANAFKTTIWGTKIPKVEESDDESETFDAEEMIRKAREANELEESRNRNSKGKKKKKKLVLLSSDSVW
ncbi:uncharacterized protein PRCAT00002727001 [Priceomyces carsonii]|uniref:uncharacterized protein n=1 Tax=Priceomyces carsonii TaxID=28549 RepID=UPI002ED8B192|nr:unnamed protein product [Priceomyces carsonii]